MSRIYQAVDPSGARMWVGMLDCGAWSWCRTQGAAEEFIRRFQRGHGRINLSQPREEDQNEANSDAAP